MHHGIQIPSVEKGRRMATSRPTMASEVSSAMPEADLPTSAHLILYVRDQERARAFYETALGLPPRLHVPGMTEFALPGGAVLGLIAIGKMVDQ